MLVGYLNLLWSFYGFLWNKDNPIKNQLYKNFLDRQQFDVFWSFREITFIVIYWLIKKPFSINHNIVVFYFYVWTIISFTTYSLCIIFKWSKNPHHLKFLFIPWKRCSTKWFKFLFYLNSSGFDVYFFQWIVF